MDKTQGLNYLQKKLEKHRPRALARNKQYCMKKQSQAIGFTIPPAVRQQYKSVLGWCAKAVDVVADRLIFREFADDYFEINEIFQLNNPDTFFDSAILGALTVSCSFVYISIDSVGYPRLQVIDGSNATGIIDPITGLLKSGYAVLERDEYGKPKREAYFLPKETTVYEDGKESSFHKHQAPYPLLVPIIHRPDAMRTFGRSRITRSAEYYQQLAQRTLERSDVTAEFYSFPQKYVVGLSQDAEPLDTWKATISSMLQFDKDEEGDVPKLGQFTVPSMSPFTEQLKTSASGFAGETGLTLSDLGFMTENPVSAEAYKASHENLRLASRKAQRNFGSGFLNVGYLSACVRDDYPYERKQFYMTQPKWDPVFEADASQLAGIGDAMNKLQQSFPDYVTEEKLRDLTGF